MRAVGHNMIFKGAVPTYGAAIHSHQARRPVSKPTSKSRNHNVHQWTVRGFTSFTWPSVQLHAEPEKKESVLNVKTITSVLWEAQSAWGKYAEKNDELSLEDATAILNGPELRKVALTLFNVEPAHHTPKELEDKFKQADTDRSGRLSRVEFLALYLSVVTGRVQMSPGILAEALLGFIDTDRNGRIEGGELKVLLTLVGFPMAMFLPIPKSVGVDYRAWLSKLNGGSSHVS